MLAIDKDLHWRGDQKSIFPNKMFPLFFFIEQRALVKEQCTYNKEFLLGIHELHLQSFKQNFVKIGIFCLCDSACFNLLPCLDI